MSYLLTVFIREPFLPYLKEKMKLRAHFYRRTQLSIIKYTVNSRISVKIGGILFYALLRGFALI